MRKILTSCAILIAGFSFAQVGISGNASDTPRATLDVKKIENSSVANGVIIPNVSKQEAQTMPNPVKSTLVYIDNVSAAAASRTGKVDAEGFYYFDGTEWVKVGSGASAPVVLGPTTGKYQKLPTPVAATSINDDTFAVIVTGTSTTTLELPNPGGNNTGRVLAVNNQGGSILTFTGEFQPKNTNGVESGAGFFLISDGTGWYLIGGVGI